MGKEPGVFALITGPSERLLPALDRDGAPGESIGLEPAIEGRMQSPRPTLMFGVRQSVP